MLAPDVETRPWAEQLAVDDESYRAQLEYLFDRSTFYREKLTAAGFASAEVAGGLAGIAKLPHAGPFVAGAALAAFDRIGLCHIPVGTGNTERMMLAVQALGPEAVALTDAIRDKLRNVLVVQTRVDLVPWGTLQRSEYKSTLVDR